MDCMKKLLQSKQTIYFKTSCDFICKFLQHVTNLQDDRLVRSCIDVANHYMQIASEDCRFNAVFFVCKFLSHIESLDEFICNVLKLTLPQRIRDKKPSIRAQAVLASRKFQDNKMIQDGFLHHFSRDPELSVRKALLQTMDVEIFGEDFLVESTQDTHETIRKAAYQRLGKLSPNKLTLEQLHCVLHNGLFERERQASISFKTNALDIWLLKLYDGLDSVQLLSSFDVVNYQEDVDRLLEYIHERDLEKLENNGTATKLHHVVEAFHEKWLSSSNKCLPPLDCFDERVTTVWLSLIKFCKNNQSFIKYVKIRAVPAQNNDPNQSIERILSSQEQNDEVVELYERLTPDLVNLVDFLKRFIRHADQMIKKKESEKDRLEFIYHNLMNYMLAYEIGDELERKTVQEVLSLILKENLLTGKFVNFIPPIIKCLFKLIYNSNSTHMTNYISELINNVRSHLEDIVTPSQQQIAHSTIMAPGKTPKSAKKVTINQKLPTRDSLTPIQDEQNLEFKIATIRIDIEELKDKVDECVKCKDFAQAATIQKQIEHKTAELNLLHSRRYSIASDVSHMSLVIDNEIENKLSSTVLPEEVSMDESRTSFDGKEDIKVFKHQTDELLKCLQMYYACLENVRVTEVPQTMRNHLSFLSYEALDEWFKNNTRVRSLMVACNGLTALMDNQFARLDTTKTLLIAACYDSSRSLEIKTVGFKGLVDIMIEHRDLEIPMDKLEKFLNLSLRDYGKYDPKNIRKDELEFITAIIEGTAKLYYHQKFDSPEILSHIILWWYHPRTYSRLTQFIGVFLPQFVKDLSNKRGSERDDWLEELLAQTFVTSIEYLHDYCLGPGQRTMDQSDMHSLINFLCTLVPISFHTRVMDVVDKRIDDLSSSSPDLIKYLKQSKNNLTAATPLTNVTVDKNKSQILADPIACPIQSQDFEQD